MGTPWFGSLVLTRVRGQFDRCLNPCRLVSHAVRYPVHTVTGMNAGTAARVVTICSTVMFDSTRMSETSLHLCAASLLEHIKTAHSVTISGVLNRLPAACEGARRVRRWPNRVHGRSIK